MTGVLLGGFGSRRVGIASRRLGRSMRGCQWPGDVARDSRGEWAGGRPARSRSALGAQRFRQCCSAVRARLGGHCAWARPCAHPRARLGGRVGRALPVWRLPVPRGHRRQQTRSATNPDLSRTGTGTEDEETAPPEVFNATYADGPHNAEAMFVVGGDLFIVTRDRMGGVYRTTTTGSRELTLQRIGQLGLAAVTDAETSRDEKPSW